MSESNTGEDFATESPPAPYLDEELLRKLYRDECMSIMAIGEQLDCSPTTVSKYLDEFGIEKRSPSQQISIGYGNGPDVVPFQTHTTGPECWRHTHEGEKNTVYVHRLVAVAEYGFDAVAGNDVHHKNEVPWDNRPENLTVLTHGEHSTHHRTKISGLDRLRIAELYENGDVSYRELHDVLDYDVSWATIMDIHHSFVGRGRHAQ